MATNDIEQTKPTSKWNALIFVAIIVVIAFVIFVIIEDQPPVNTSKDEKYPKTQWQIRDSIQAERNFEAKIRSYNDTSGNIAEPEKNEDTPYVVTVKPTYTYENVDVLLDGRWVQTRVRKQKTSGYRLKITGPRHPK